MLRSISSRKKMCMGKKSYWGISWSITRLINNEHCKVQRITKHLWITEKGWDEKLDGKEEKTWFEEVNNWNKNGKKGTDGEKLYNNFWVSEPMVIFTNIFYFIFTIIGNNIKYINLNNFFVSSKGGGY